VNSERLVHFELDRYNNRWYLVAKSSWNDEGEIMQIACLHTLDSNVPVFDEAAKSLDVSVVHEVREDFLLDAEASGGLTNELADRVAEAIAGLSHEADAVVLTCSTVGPSVVPARRLTSKPVLRVDEALAQQAVGSKGKLVVLYAVQTTLKPSRQLFSGAGALSENTIYKLVDGAWDAFKSGDISQYNNLVARAADAIFENGEVTVAFAQASMSGAAALCSKGVPLISPIAGLNAARQLANGV
jgi:hypothetical protein